MIAWLGGRLMASDADGAVIDTGGVGYAVSCSSRTLDALPAAGEAAELFVETHVRDDAIHLYGFADRAERGWFRLLVTVQGVGARVALGILSALTPDDLAVAIAAQDREALRQVPGVGPKVAGRILSELRDKADAPPFAAADGAGPWSGRAGAAPDGDEIAAEAVSALVNLGYGRGEAFAAIARAGKGDLAGRIRRGLKALSTP